MLKNSQFVFMFALNEIQLRNIVLVISVVQKFRDLILWKDNFDK